MTTPVVHVARPHRPVLVAGTLDELTGPEHGPVELPPRGRANSPHQYSAEEPILELGSELVDDELAA